MKPVCKLLLALTIAVSSFTASNAQGDLGEILKGSSADATYLAEGYIAPFLRTYSSGLNQGWYNTAKPHKVGGFDLTVSVALVKVPESDKTFTVDNSKLSNIFLYNTNQPASSNLSPATGTGQVPTIFGSSTAPSYRFKDSNDNDLGQEFDGPAGNQEFEDVLKGSVPVPVANLSLGLPKGIELKVRWTPEINFGDGSLKMIGFGVMHDIKQYIPGIKMLPFDLSALAAFSKMDVGVDFNDAGTQRGEFSVKATSVQAIISKKISVITPYAAIGYGFSSATLKVLGDYDVDNNITTPPVKDPVNMEEKISGPRITTGVRLKLAIFTFHGDYTIQKYNTLTVGFGLSVR